jgi:hypothetical protein
MSFTIVQSPGFLQSGIALNSSSCVEQVNGLIEVQARFTIPKSRQAEIDRLFFVDAQPPIDPSCVTKASLLTQRLYMVKRSVTSENGFLVIDALYVGGLVRSGFSGFYLTEQFDRRITVSVTTENVNITGTSTVTQTYLFDCNEISVEFIQIGGVTSAAVPSFEANDLIPALRGSARSPFVFTASVRETTAYETPTVKVVTRRHIVD